MVDRQSEARGGKRLHVPDELLCRPIGCGDDVDLARGRITDDASARHTGDT
jgi:hypothetical protein